MKVSGNIDLNSISPAAIAEGLSKIVHMLERYRVILFALLIISVYGFLLVRINSLSSAQPPASAVNQNLQAQQTPVIDQSVVQKLQDLQDNSVNVKALFNQARQNPFQE